MREDERTKGILPENSGNGRQGITICESTRTRLYPGYPFWYCCYVNIMTRKYKVAVAEEIDLRRTTEIYNPVTMICLVLSSIAAEMISSQHAQ